MIFPVAISFGHHYHFLCYILSTTGTQTSWAIFCIPWVFWNLLLTNHSLGMENGETKVCVLWKTSVFSFSSTFNCDRNHFQSLPESLWPMNSLANVLGPTRRILLCCFSTFASGSNPTNWDSRSGSFPSIWCNPGSPHIKSLWNTSNITYLVT